MSKSALKSYANTTVSPHRSKEQIEELLQRVGATGFVWKSFTGEETIQALLEWQGKKLGFQIEIRYEDERERKQRLRAMYWYLKSKIEAIQFGLVELEREFLPYLLTQSGRTVFEEIGENLPTMLALPSGTEAKE